MQPQRETLEEKPFTLSTDSLVSALTLNHLLIWFSGPVFCKETTEYHNLLFNLLVNMFGEGESRLVSLLLLLRYSV